MVGKEMVGKNVVLVFETVRTNGISIVGKALTGDGSIRRKIGLCKLNIVFNNDEQKHYLIIFEKNALLTRRLPPKLNSRPHASGHHKVY